jgi:predicted glycosyltransferase
MKRLLRVALYSHDAMGLGHMRRNLLLASALRGFPVRADVLLISGARELNAFPLPSGVDSVTLPGMAKIWRRTYVARRLHMDTDALAHMRARLILTTLDEFEPDLLIVDKHPRGLLNELDGALALLSARRGRRRTRVVLGMRDVLDDPATTRREWAAAHNDDAIRRHYDAIWIYGDPLVYDQLAEYGFAADIAARVRFTGYLDPRLRYQRPGGGDGQAIAALGLEPGRTILCQIGGGQDGARVAETFAATELPADTTGVLVTGPYLPLGARERVQRLAATRPRLRVLDFLSEPERLLRYAHRVVTMGGYNSVCEVLSSGVSALIVPRVAPRTEQLIRAERLRTLGLADMMHPSLVTPTSLGTATASISRVSTGCRGWSRRCSMAERRFAIFTHDAYGLGHVRRSSRILRALAEREPDAALLLITGSPATHLLRELPQHADTLKLPTIITSGADGARPPTLNIGVAELASLRGELTRRALELFEPDVLLVDNFPLGTRHELLPALRELRHRPTRTALGLRDIVDPPEKVRRDWGRDGIHGAIERYYDRVLVYGMREVLDAGAEYGLSAAVVARLAYCGYVTETGPPRVDAAAVRREHGVADGFLLATVGGGGDGRPLLEAFVTALQRFPDRAALITTGEFMSAGDRAAVSALANGNGRVVIRDHVADLPSVMAAADLVVAMGGYNTSAEILAVGARAVVVPRSWRSGEHGTRGKTGVDAEQLVRAEGLTRLGAVRTLDARGLTSDALADAMQQSLAAPRPDVAARLNLDGAGTVADRLIELADTKEHSR